MARWQVPPPANMPAEILNFVGEPLLARLLVQRGLTTMAQVRAFLDPEAYRPAPAAALPDLPAAVDRLGRAIERQELICVWGDFDVDGQTAASLLVSTLQHLGARVCFYIPNRLTESHGLKIPALQRQLARGVNLILTCDTGIDAFEAVNAARAGGAEVIITDHHDLPDSLPAATAVVNPKRLPAGHPLAELPGVGVAYKLAEALFQAQRQAAGSETLLDLVALGIVADVARQTGDTRYLLQRGLAALHHTERIGLHALLESAGLKAERLTEEHVGFWLAPRLNALGRLGDANLAVELLTTADLAQARIIALQLEALNDRRKMLVDRVVVQTFSQLEDTPSLLDYRAIVLAAADWHPGVLGLAASRLSDRFGKPAILLALRPDGLAYGSARSVPGCDIHRALKTQAGLLNSFGGHPLAAGLSLRPENIAAFRQGLSAALIDCQLDTEPLVTLDAWLNLADISPELLASIRRLAPFGAGNPPVRLGCRGLRVAAEAVFGKTGQHKRLVVQDEAGQSQEVIRWGGAAERSPAGPFDLAFTLAPDNFRGDGAVQVTWLDAQEWTPPAVIPTVEFYDWRREANPLTRLQELNSALDPRYSELVVWAEGVTVPDFSPVLRHQLHPAEALVIWTAPPGHDIFQQALAAAQPRQVYVVGQPSPFDTLPAFMRRLLGLVKYALAQQEGEVDLGALAAALGQRATTARLGLDWLIAQGRLTLYAEEDERLVVRPANQPPAADPAAIEAMLQTALAETAAYRRFFGQAGLKALRQAAG
ncbi:MAG: single-stranded-DNA-specific exonuclease RecJ [Chloroflexota bacterium]